MVRKINISILVLSLIEDVAAFYYLFSIPSMEKNAIFLDYSLSRLLLGLSILVIILPMGAVLISIFSKPVWFDQQLLRLKVFLEEDNHLLSVLTSLVYFVILAVTSIVFFSTPSADRLEMITVVYDRAFSLILYAALLCLQCLVLLYVNFPVLYRNLKFYHCGTIVKIITILLIISTTVFNWLVLYLKVNLYNQIPYWYWKFWPKEFKLEIIFNFMAILLATGFVLWLINKYPDRIKRNLILLVVLGVYIQASFGFLEGDGFESIRLKFVKAGHNAYAENASCQPDVLDSMVHYEEIYGEEMYLDTKPPGLLLFNLITQRISNSINPVDDFDGRYERMTTFMAYVFPIVSYLPLLFLFYFSKSFLSIKDSYLVCIAYIFLPNVTLMVLELDQVLFPLLFIAGLVIWKIAIDKQSLVLAVLTGMFCYLCVFITYSLLPMLGLLVFWYMLEFFLQPEKRNWRNAIKMALGLTGGMLISLALYRYLINYDVILRYQNGMARHLFHKQYNSGGNTFSQMLLLNNLELAVWSGFPLIIFYISRTIKALINTIRRKFSRMDIFALAFFLMYFILNIMGQTRSEVGRLWLFMMPAMVLISINEMLNLFKNKKLGIMFFIILQLITIFITYQFQDAINL